jgi:hypothetical protein
MNSIIFQWIGKDLEVDWPRDAPLPRKGDMLILPGHSGRVFTVSKVLHHLGDHFKEAGVEGETFPFVKTYISVHYLE